jgi:hypothetical protein
MDKGYKNDQATGFPPLNIVSLDYLAGKTGHKLTRTADIFECLLDSKPMSTADAREQLEKEYTTR